MADKLLERGQKVRDKVVGKGYRRLNKVDPDLLEHITRSAFGDIWARDGLDITTRRIIALSFNLALNRGEEFKLHAVYGLRNGMTKEQLKEICLQAAVYCGVPASLDAFRDLDDAIAIYEREEAWKKSESKKGKTGKRRRK